MTALALRDDQDYWDEKQLAVLYQTGIGDQVTKAELASFLHLCQRTGLDPFARQIYLIGRWDKRAGREVFRPQTGIDGYRVIAQRTCERTKKDLGYEDTQWCGEDGKWTDVWLAPDPPAAAKVTVLRAGKRFPAIARWSEYVPLDRDGRPTGLWVKRHAAQLEKCAEALALRKAFPNDMAGVYTSEEMEQADNPAQPVQPVSVERISEERAAIAAGMPPDETWHVHPAPEPVTDQEWLAATLRVAPQIGVEACRNLWREATEKQHKGELADPDAETVFAAIKARVDELKGAQHDTPVLADDDPWHDPVYGAADITEAETLLADAESQLRDGAIDGPRFEQIEAVIKSRFPDAGKVAA